MASSSNAIPLHVEFETIIRYIQEEHTCIAKVPFLPKCRNKLSKKSGRRIIQLLEGFVLAIQRGECLDKDLLTEASSLLMCNRRHQGLAALQLEDWCERKESVDAIVEHSPETLELPTPDLITKISDDLNSLDINIDGFHTGETATAGAEQSEDYSISTILQASIEDDFEDSAICLEEVNATDEVKSVELLSSASGSPSTPKRPAVPAKFDSAISMSNGEDIKAIIELACPESPTAAKAQRSTRESVTRAVLAPEQSRATSLEPEFFPFSNPLKKLTQYMKKPLTPTHMTEGYIYCFQIEGTNKNKIGSALPRKRTKKNGERVEIPLEKSFKRRMAEHKNEWDSAPRIMLQLKVPHARRIEKIIHFHLEKGRMKELASPERQKKSKKKIPLHNEWFNNSFAEISKVMMAWSYWSFMTPYEEVVKDGKSVYGLTSHWEASLQGLKPQPFRDHWLDWLYKHVPEVGINMPLSTQDLIEREGSDHLSEAIVRNNAMGDICVLKRSSTSHI